MTPLIHVVDDDLSMRTGLQRLITEAGYETRVYGSAGEFLLEPLPDRPGCILLDLQLPGPSGLELQTALQRQNIHLPVIFLTGFADVSSSVQAMKAGAVDFLEKPVHPDVLFAAIRNSLAKEQTQRALREDEKRLRTQLATLSTDQREVLHLILEGKLNKQIAHELQISERTVKLRRAELMTKLDVHSAAELGVRAEQLRRMSNGN
jgi:FixJ family two-component response regulator